MKLPNKLSILQRLKTAVNIALSGNYDIDVNPAYYEAYVDRIGRRSALAKALAETITAYIPVFTDENLPANILDIAAGTGIISRALAAKGYAVTSTDLSQNALEFLHRQSPATATQQADMNQRLPFNNNSFDGATTVWGNRYIRDTNAFLNEVCRVLKPGGVFLWPVFPIEGILWKMKNGLKQHTAPKNLMKDAVMAGFNKVQVKKMSFSEAVKQKISPFSIPSYIVARK